LPKHSSFNDNLKGKNQMKLNAMNLKSNLMRSLLLVAMTLMLVTPAQAYFAPSNGQAAALVLGQPNFTSHSAATTQSGMNNPAGVAVDPTTYKVFVADSSNNRVLRFASLFALTNSASAEAVLGQPDFIHNTVNTTQSGMNDPIGIFVDASGRLWVADFENQRVLRFDNAASKGNGANADGVLGQIDFTSNHNHATQGGMNEPYSVFMDSGGRLWVADYANNRVLRFDNAASKANGANADGVLGQPTFTSNTANTTQSGMENPASVFVDSGGRLWVADMANYRVLRFDNAVAKANGANADGVLGQSNFTSDANSATQTGMNFPQGVAVDNGTGRLYVADTQNDRILVYNSAASLANGANASFVLGQTDFTSSGTGSASATNLFYPLNVFYDQVTKVLVAGDYFNNRVLMYGKPSHNFSSTSTAADDGWVLESTATSGVGGTLSATGSLRVGDDASNKQYRSILYFDTSSLPDNAVIHSVTLKIHKAGAVGIDPQTSGAFGSLLADMQKGTFGTPALQALDFQATASANAIGHFTSIGGGWYQLLIPASDFKYVNLTGVVTQFRLRFTLTSNNNHVADYDTFYPGDAASANRPVLTVEYSLP
jgi:sugar lactone lactonase YvrE